jgi:hypothetical protein
MDIMQEWVENELYSELIAMPLWTISAFQGLNSTELPSTDARHLLIKYLVTKHMQRCPYNTDHENDWRVYSYNACIRMAVMTCKKENAS